MRNRSGRWQAAVLAAILSACAAPPASPTPTSVALPTLPPPPTATIPAGSEWLPLVDLTPSLILEPPEFVPSATPTLLSLPLPPEKLILEAPGPGSQSGTPVRVVGYAGPAARDLVTLRLLGEDGRELSLVRTYLLVPSGRAGRFVADLSFQIPTVAEAAIVEASYQNPFTGRLDHLATRRLILLTTGRPLLRSGMVGAEKLSIFTPREDQVIEGGSVHIRGAAWLDEDVPLLVELIDRQGNLLSYTETMPAAPKPGELGTFEVTLPYTVPYPQYGWVAVSERGLDPPTLLHYTSLRVYLK